MDLNDLATFVVVAEAGTFSAAAERLGVPTSTVSRRVARLEEELGLALLTRSTRSFALSDDGRALVERCAPALREIEHVERDLGDALGAPRGRVRVTASIDFGTSRFLCGLLADYALEFPQVQVDLGVTNRLVDLVEEGFDFALRTHTGPLADRDDLVARRLAPIPFAVFASPEYLARRGPIDRWDGAAEHVTVCHAHAHRARWPVPPTLTPDDYGPAAALLAAGAGFGGVPVFVAAPYVARGALVRLPLEWDVPETWLSLVWPRRRHGAPRLRAFIDRAVRHARQAGGLD